MATETLVSKTSPAIEQIIAATVGADWPGKKVVVREVPHEWHHTEYIDDKTLAWYLNLDVLSSTGQVRVYKIPEPRYGGPAVEHGAPQPHEALIHVWRWQGRQGMSIIVLQDAIDSQAVAVATDALLAGGKKAKEFAVTSAKLCGATGGLCLAIAEANAKTLMNGERPPSAGVTGRQRKSAAQLEAEIQAVIRRRG